MAGSHMLPIHAILDAENVNLPMRVILTDVNGVDWDGCLMHDEANACIVRGRVVTVGHLGRDLPPDSKLKVIEPRTLRSEYALFKNKLPWHDAAILDIKPSGPEFMPARPVIGENVVLSSYTWDDEAKKSKFTLSVGKIVKLMHTKLYDSKYKCPFLIEGKNSHLRYIIKAPSCPADIECGSSVTNSAGQLVGIINGIDRADSDIRYMSSIIDILENDQLDYSS